MRPVYVALNAIASSPWIPLDRQQDCFNVGIQVSLSEDASAITYSVQATCDPMGDEYLIPCSIARAAGVATVTTLFQHGLNVGDAVIVTGSGSAALDSQPFVQSNLLPPFYSNSGQATPWNVATAPTPTTFTYAVANSGPLADAGVTKLRIYRVAPVPNLSALSAKAFQPLIIPATALRLVVTALTAGFAQMGVIQGIGR